MKRGARFVSLAILAAGLAWGPAPALEAAGPGGEVLPMSPENLDRLAKGLAAEEAARKAFAAKAPKTKSPEEYGQCITGVLTGPEAAKLTNDLNAALKKYQGNPDALVKAGEKMQKDQDALIEKTCGPNPSVSRADAFDRQRGMADATAKDVGLTPRQYAILKERVAPLCALGKVPAGPDGAKVKGPGGTFWVYSAAEVAALTPRCAALTKALRIEEP